MGDHMRKCTHYIVTATLLLVFILLILDTKTATSGASQGIELCLETLIPALFPFLFLSSISKNLLLGTSSKLATLVTLPLKLPSGTESIFLLGILGGYPVGAKLVSDAYKNGDIPKADAERMLMFSSNAGPSFIFGVMDLMFNETWVPWLMWIIHISSAYLVGVLYSATTRTRQYYKPGKSSFQLTDAVADSVKTSGLICGWVIAFKILISFLNKYFFKKLPVFLKVLFYGLLELSNGSVSVANIDNCGLRFLSALLIITFGGLCVTMQTASILSGLSLKHYLTGKLLQCLFAIAIALPMQAFVFDTPYRTWKYPFLLFIMISIAIIIKQISKNSRIPRVNGI